MSFDRETAIFNARRALIGQTPAIGRGEDAAEGGCGVLGFAASLPIAGRHVLTASAQMHNRGNGKGGGIAMAGLDPAQTGVDAAALRSHYLLQIALLDPAARLELEAEFITPHFEIARAYEIPRLDDYRAVPGLDVRPPDVWRYFVRLRPEVLARFAEQTGLQALEPRQIEDEFIYQNSYRLNLRYYASLGEKRAFVLSHGRDLSVLKLVGYAEDVVAYYRLEEQTAHVWIAHQRYPTKGRVWHPGGAHPFIGLNEALVHNGDFANYHAVSEYLRQRNIGQLFLTDTEVSVQLFDLWQRVYDYPLEVTLEAMAPTTEHDFAMLPAEKQELYRAVQRAHLHASPDGPWFFILARSLADEGRCELLGITDTSMLRPQVFALYENPQAALPGGGHVQIGLIASERQAINACLRSLCAEDGRFQPYADRYWAARGGSHTDGGSFRFSVERGAGGAALRSMNKFGAAVAVDADLRHLPADWSTPLHGGETAERAAWLSALADGPERFANWAFARLPSLGWAETAAGLLAAVDFAAAGPDEWEQALAALTLLRDRRAGLGDKKRASFLRLVDQALQAVFEQVPGITSDEPAHSGGNGQYARAGNGHGIAHPGDNGNGAAPGETLPHLRLTWETRTRLAPPANPAARLLLDGRGFAPEGDESAARWLVRAYQMGWRRLLAYHFTGGRFAGCGLGADTFDARLDLYGDVGDYTASGLDGGEIVIHGDGQDQLGQILKRGRLVVHGDAGQTFLYGAKGGEIYVLGSAAGRPLINAVGRPRAVINGTCLDYLAESFMAGDPHNGGGFVILNGVGFDERGRLVDLPSPYPGGNLFSLASGGAIFLRDPHQRVLEDQLNGGVFAALSEADWALILPYLQENERLFGIFIEDMLTVDGVRLPPQAVYRKVTVAGLGALADTPATLEAENR